MPKVDADDALGFSQQGNSDWWVDKDDTGATGRQPPSRNQSKQGWTTQEDMGDQTPSG